VATLVEDHMEVGWHDVQFSGIGDDGQRLASGVYIYRMEAGDFACMKKFTFLK
jgi:hypothetical protein